MGGWGGGLGGAEIWSQDTWTAPKRLLYLKNWREIIFEGGLVFLEILDRIGEININVPTLLNKYKIILVARVIFRQHFQ